MRTCTTICCPPSPMLRRFTASRCRFAIRPAVRRQGSGEGTILPCSRRSPRGGGRGCAYQELPITPEKVWRARKEGLMKIEDIIVRISAAAEDETLSLTKLAGASGRPVVGYLPAYAPRNWCTAGGLAAGIWGGGSRVRSSMATPTSSHLPPAAQRHGTGIPGVSGISREWCSPPSATWCAIFPECGGFCFHQW